MRQDRSHMTVRIVALGDPDADVTRAGGTLGERLAAVAQLTELGWALARLPRRQYSRREMPVVVTTLSAQALGD
jgi:hypothetical protein